MKFLVFRRDDRALLVLPSLFQPPLASRGHGSLESMGTFDLEHEFLDPKLAQQLDQEGFALIDGEAWELLKITLEIATQNESPEALPAVFAELERLEIPEGRAAEPGLDRRLKES